jgi:hypothetical protein
MEQLTPPVFQIPRDRRPQTIRDKKRIMNSEQEGEADKRKILMFSNVLCKFRAKIVQVKRTFQELFRDLWAGCSRNF